MRYQRWRGLLKACLHLLSESKSNHPADYNPRPPLQEENHVTANHLAMLEELVVEAELFCRYALIAQAHEALAKIREKFPFEEEHNPRLRELCLTLGVEPRDAPSSRAQSAADSSPQACGLLKRSAYSDVLLAEIGRAKAQKSPLTLLLLEFAAHSAPPGDTRASQEGSATSAAVVGPGELMHNAGETICSQLRHSDLAVRYGPEQIVVLLAGTAGKDASPIVENLRRALKRACGENGCAPTLTAGVAEANLDPRFDAAQSRPK